MVYRVTHTIDNWKPGACDWHGDFTVSAGRLQIRFRVTFTRERMCARDFTFSEPVSDRDRDIHEYRALRAVEAWAARRLSP